MSPNILSCYTCTDILHTGHVNFKTTDDYFINTQSVYMPSASCVEATRAVDASTRLEATDNTVAPSYLPDRLSDTMYIPT